MSGFLDQYCAYEKYPCCCMHVALPINSHCCMVSSSSVQSLSHVQLCDSVGCSTPGLPVHHQLPEFTQTHATELVMPSNPLILCHPLLLPSVFPSIRVFSNESVWKSILPNESVEYPTIWIIYNVFHTWQRFLSSRNCKIGLPGTFLADIYIRFGGIHTWE